MCNRFTDPYFFFFSPIFFLFPSIQDCGTKELPRTVKILRSRNPKSSLSSLSSFHPSNLTLAIHLGPVSFSDVKVTFQVQTDYRCSITPLNKLSTHLFNLVQMSVSNREDTDKPNFRVMDV